MQIMAENVRLTVRPFSQPARPDLKDALRVNLSASVLLSLRLRAGDLCFLHQDGIPDRAAVAWQAAEKIHDSVIQMSQVMQDLYGLRLGDKVSVYKSPMSIQNAKTVELREIRGEDVSASSADNLLAEDRPYWEWFLHEPLTRAATLTPGLRLKSVQLRGPKRDFIVTHIRGGGSVSPSMIYQYASDIKVSIVDRESVPEHGARLEITSACVGGLDRQLEQINLLLRDYDADFQAITRDCNYSLSQGLLLYGLKGTGKSLLVDKLAACSWKNVIRCSAVSSARADAWEQLDDAFVEALRQQPCLMIIEQIGSSRKGLLESSPNPSLILALQKGFETIRHSQVLVVAEVRHPNDIDETLRAPTRFDIEIELPVPAASERVEMLRCIRRHAKQLPEHVLQDMAARTHGYVGADLCALLKRATKIAAHRALSLKGNADHQLNRLTINDQEDQSSGETSSSDHSPTFTVELTDAQLALAQIRPSAMQEVILEAPNVHWSSIGGQQALKTRLRRIIYRSLHLSRTMARVNLRPYPGVLLYGPPGCSKTLLAKALATESGLNFLAVKGAELVSMYVGESERAIRDLFRKARQASPSIIFFDEFEAIASSRGDSSNSTGGGTGGHLNTVSTLLNEMDGFESLGDVFILAATNRPQILDSALLRPGRIDKMVYVGPPDLDARRETLSLWLAKSTTRSDVDVDALAALTAGYSGAELVSICETAAEFAMDDMEDAGLQSAWGLGEKVVVPGGPQDVDDAADVSIGMEHLRRAVCQVKKGITEDVVRAYEEWGVLG